MTEYIPFMLSLTKHVQSLVSSLLVGVSKLWIDLNKMCF